MMANLQRLRVFRINRPIVVITVMCEVDIVGIGAISEVTPTSGRQRSDNVGVREVNASILTTGQWQDIWLQTPNMAAQAIGNVRVLRTNTHRHEFVYTHHCNINSNILIEYMQSI